MILFLAFVSIFVIYSRSLNGEFLFDDPAIWDMDFERWRLAYQGKDRPSDPPSFAKAFWYSFLEEPRSLTHMGYFWTWQFAGFRPRVWHSVNIVLHAVNTFLVYLLASTFLSPGRSSIAALLFAIHPHQVAAVSYISGRASLQVCFFAIAGLYIAVSFPIWLGWPAIYFCMMFAERSKEDGTLWFFLITITYAVLRVWLG